MLFRSLVAQQMKKDHERAVRRRKHLDTVWANAIWGVVAVIIACCIGLMFAYVIQDRIEKYPQLGTGIIPKTEAQRKYDEAPKTYVGR